MATSLGRYEIVARLSQGGMAEVFLARRRGVAGVDKRVVIKRIRAERARDPRFFTLFVREARLSMSLAHENIVPVFDFGRAGNEIFLAMEHVEGRDLSAVLERAAEVKRPLDPVLCAYLGAEACQGLDYAHRRRDESGRALGVVHRDITPRNVLVSFSGEVKIVDFGIAHLGADEEEAGRIRGTPAYMSPEQARGERVDARSDLFSLGLVLWTALSGHAAYRGDGLEELFAQARAAKVPPLPDAVPAPLRAIVERATRASPDERFQDARAMQLALDGVVVAARAADPARPAPSHQLAEWMTALFPEGEGATPAGDVSVSSAKVVTYLDDGELSIHATRTSFSLVETAAEAPVAAVAAAPPETPAPRRPRWPVGLAVAASLVAAVAVWQWPRTGPERALTPVPDAPGAAAGQVLVAATTEAVPDAGVADAPPARAADTPPPRPRRPASAPGTVLVNSTPWSRVTVAGQGASCAETPCSLTLPPGRHTLRLFNPIEKTGKTVRVDVRSGEERVVEETLTRAP